MNLCFFLLKIFCEKNKSVLIPSITVLLIITKNIYTGKDNIFRSLQKLRKNKDIIIISADKDPWIVILNKKDYVRKVDEMIGDDITERKYIETTDNTLCDLKCLKWFQKFLYHHFYEHKDYEGMLISVLVRVLISVAVFSL